MWLLGRPSCEKNKVVFLLCALGVWILVYWFWLTKNSNPYGENTIKIELIDPINTSDNQGLGSQTMEPTSLKIMTWNLQGLMNDRLKERTNAVISVILEQSPAVIFFQELIPSSYTELTNLLRGSYVSVRGTDNKSARYFTGIFYREGLFKTIKHEILKFRNSVMERTLLTVKLSLGRLKLAVLTSHLESLPGFSAQRKEQLKQSLEICSSMPKQYNVVFGGDLNLEENEEEGLIPDNIKDIWQECGSLESNKYTWDYTVNKNEKIPETEGQPRKRLDRLYFRGSEPETMRLMDFSLDGQKLVDGTEYYPSDHWALVSVFQVDNFNGNSVSGSNNTRCTMM